MTRPTTKPELSRHLAELFLSEGLDYTLRKYTCVEGMKADELDPKLAMLWRLYQDVATSIEAHVGASHDGIPSPSLDPWRLVIRHAIFYEGGPGIVIPKDGESYEDCLLRYELPLTDEDGEQCWKLVRVRRPLLAVSEIDGPALDYELILEGIEDELHDGGAPDLWQADWEEPLLSAAPGAEQALRLYMDLWGGRYVRVEANELHPEDRS